MGVRRWLRSRPLRRDIPDFDKYKPDEDTLITQVRWIDHAEHVKKQDESALLHDTGHDATPFTSKTEIFQAAAHKAQLGARASNAFVDRETEHPDHIKETHTDNFIVACVVRLGPRGMRVEKEGKHDNVTLSPIQEQIRHELKCWPQRKRQAADATDGNKLIDPTRGEQERNKILADPKNQKKRLTVEVKTDEELRYFLPYLSDDGLITDFLHPDTKLKTATFDVNAFDVLEPGDTLLVGKGQTIQKIEDLWADGLFTRGQTILLEFIPGLRMHTATCIEVGLYSDMHDRFCDFPGGKQTCGKTLNISDTFKSLPQLGKELRNLQQRDNHSSSERPPPRRIAGLSARRHPIQAMNRGCK